MRRLVLAVLALALALLGVAGSAQAVVVALGQSHPYGVALVPGTRATTGAGLPIVTSAGACADPWLTPDLTLAPTGLCSHGGPVIHANETFALTWDAAHTYWPTTLNYVEQFLRDVADGSGTLTSPFALTGQYRDAGGPAANSSLYGGGCADEGAAGGFTCSLGNTNGSGQGNDYPASGCKVADPSVNGVCLTADQLESELVRIVGRTSLTTTVPGHQPLVVLLTPPGVEVCMDATSALCSVNGATAKAQFCSYHSHVVVGGTDVAYVVQPWNGVSACDEPDAPKIPANPPVDTLQTDVGARFVSPLSQAMLGAITNPDLNGWSAVDGSEINDNGGCAPLANGLDTVTVGSGSYFLQREFNNTGVIVSNPNALPCSPNVLLAPTFVAPSAVRPGDIVQFDGSTTVTSLLVPKAAYRWDYGDGQTAIGPSVEHAYAAGGSYTVKLTVTDRGGNTAGMSRTIAVLGQHGVIPPSTGTPPATQGLLARLALLPQGLEGMLRSGVAIRVTSNQPASALATISISRGAARRAHLHVGRAASVVIGRGTIAGVADGTTYLRIRVGHAMAAKLGHLRHLTLSVRMLLITAGRGHIAVDAAGNY